MNCAQMMNNMNELFTKWFRSNGSFFEQFQRGQFGKAWCVVTSGQAAFSRPGPPQGRAPSRFVLARGPQRGVDPAFLNGIRDGS